MAVLSVFWVGREGRAGESNDYYVSVPRAICNDVDQTVKAAEQSFYNQGGTILVFCSADVVTELDI